MAAPKGTRPPAAGKGRRKGVRNRTTRDVREVIAAFIEDNADGVQVLYDRIAKKNPVAALSLYARIAEFVVPKLTRSEVRLPDITGRSIETITSPESAVTAYMQLMGDPSLDASMIMFAIPASSPQTIPKAINGEGHSKPTDDSEARLGEPLRPSGEGFNHPEGNVVHIHEWERLGK